MTTNLMRAVISIERAADPGQTSGVRSLLFAALLPLTACSRPEPPTLTPELAAVTGITPAGIDLRVRLDAYNPNGIGLSARSVKASVVLDGRYDVGTVSVPTPLELPSKKHTRLEVPISVQWRDLASVAALAASDRGIPYQVDGTVSIGGESLNVDLPFRIAGTMTHEQVMQAVTSSLPKIPIPGLN